MRVRFLLILAVAVQPCSGRLTADEKEDQDRLIRAIVADWEAKKSQIKTIKCEAKVDSFYPRGVLSERLSLELKDEAPKTIVPAEDIRTRNEPCSWAFDLQTGKIRKESKLTQVYRHDMVYELGIEHNLHLFAEGKYKRFRPTREGMPKGYAQSAGLSPDAHFYGSMSHSFMFNGGDRPLLWLAGGVSGWGPLPDKPQRLDPVDRFTYRGEAVWKGKTCVVLAVPHEYSKTTFCEFWVQAERPHLIHRFRIAERDVVDSELDVEYGEGDGVALPARWTSIVYQPPGKLFVTLTYAIERLDLNVSLSPELFEKKLERGMTIVDAEKNRNLRVDSPGDLVPLTRHAELPLKSAPGWSVWNWILLSLVPLAIALGWRVLRTGFRWYPRNGG